MHHLISVGLVSQLRQNQIYNTYYYGEPLCHACDVLGAYVTLELLALLGMFDGEIVSHVSERNAVCLLAIFILKEWQFKISELLLQCYQGIFITTTMFFFTDITEQLPCFLGLGDVQTSVRIPTDSFHPVQV